MKQTLWDQNRYDRTENVTYLGEDLSFNYILSISTNLFQPMQMACDGCNRVENRWKVDQGCRECALMTD